MERDEFLIAVGQHRDPSLARTKTKEGEAKAAEWGGRVGRGGEKIVKKKIVKNTICFFISRV